MELLPEHLGRLVATPAAFAALEDRGLDAATLFDRHRRCDWSEMRAEDAEPNRAAIVHGSMIISAYRYSGQEFMIITETLSTAGRGDRITTLLLIDEY